jgi:branched-chain amino acid aminotransferase
MPIPIAIHSPGGALREAPFTAETLEQASFLEPEGIYTVTRTYHGDHAILLNAHLDRLQESAQIEGIPLELDRDALRASLRTLLKRAGYNESRIRLTVPRQAPDQVILAVERLQIITEETRAQGVTVATLHLARRNPRAKSNEWVKIRAEARKRMSGDVYEGIIVSDKGELTEGLSSNFYGIIDGCLRTANELILHGVARRILLTVATESIPVDLRPIQLDQIRELEEAFLTSSSRGVMPIVKIDDAMIQKGVPGPKTLALSSKYQAWVEAHLEPI